MWTAAGLILSGGLALAAWFRSSARHANYYADEVYGMTRSVHLRYAATGLALLMLFAAAFVVPLPVVPLLAVTVVAWILYGASFVRGFSAEDEEDQP